MHQQTRVLAIAGFLTALCVSQAYGLPDSRGTDFWLCFPRNYNTSTLTLFIAGEEATTGTVEIAGLAFSTTFSVTPGQVTSVAIPDAAAVTTGDGMQDKGIHVTALSEVSVYGLNRLAATTDAFLGLPTDILGTEYLLMTYVKNPTLAVVATRDGTTVTITPAGTIGARTAGALYTVALDQGQVYQLMLNDFTPGKDLTGSVITADAPIAVFGANTCTNVPPTANACDHLVEQMPPTSAWSKSFVTMPLKTRLHGDTFRILASEDGTTVSVNGASVATLNRGQFHERIIEGGAKIVADKPVLVAQFSNGTAFDGVTSDPFMMLVFPFEQFQTAYTITTPASGFSGNYVNVVVATSGAGSVLMDGSAIAANQFTAIGDSGYSGAQLTVTLGSHTFSSLVPFGLAVYGFNNADSYGYPGGGSLAPVNSVASVSLSPPTGTAVTGHAYELTATVLDNVDNPVAGVRVDFAVTGANTGAVSATTDDLGHATFSYTGAAVGEDIITASAVGLEGSAAVTWRDMLLAPPDAPIATAAADVTTTGFVANWNAVDDALPSGTLTPATTYRLDVKMDDAFVAGYEDLDVADATSIPISGLTPGTTYTYSVRAVGAGGTSESSNTITVTTGQDSPPDTDGDGLIDSEDGCPTDPAKTEPGTAGCGQPEGVPQIEVLIEPIGDSPSGTSRVGDELPFLVTVQNVGTGDANNVQITIPIPSNTELVSAELLTGPAAASLPDNMTVVNGKLVIDCGSLPPGSNVQVRLVLKAIIGGTVDLGASAQYGDNNEQVLASHPAAVPVQDTYTKIVTTTTPVSLCGATGLLSLMLTAMALALPTVSRRYRPD